MNKNLFIRFGFVLIIGFVCLPVFVPVSIAQTSKRIMIPLIIKSFPQPTATPVPTSTPIVIVAPTATLVPTSTPTAVPTATPQPNTSVCPCSSNSRNCSDFSTQSAAQACHDSCMQSVGRDIHKLDRDNDGVVCESLPLRIIWK